MSTKTTHIIPGKNGWVIKKERANVFVEKQANGWAVKRPRSARAIAVLPTQAAAIARANKLARLEKSDTPLKSGVYSTQKEAIDAAQKISRQSSSGQIVVHNRNGSLLWRNVRGLPMVQTSPRKSELGIAAIRKAVSAVIRERLERE